MTKATLRSGLALLVLFLLATAPLFAKSYRIPSIAVDVSLSTDGTVEVTEAISYSFKGRYKFAYREIPLQPGETLTDLRVGEANQAYTFDSGRSKEPGTFQIEQRGDLYKVTWFFRARSEPRTFLVSYRLKGAIERYSDVAYLRFAFIGTDWRKSIRQATGTVHFPATSDGSAGVQVWAYDRHPVENVQLASDRVVISREGLRSRTPLIGRMTFPSAWFPQLALTANEPRFAAIKFQEDELTARYAAVQEEDRLRVERQEQLAGQLLPVAIVLGLASILVWIWFFVQYGKAHKPDRTPLPGEIPVEHSPALVDYVLSRHVGARSVVTTLVDLASRGYLLVYEETKEKQGLFSSKKDDYRFELTDRPHGGLKDFERKLIDFAVTQSPEMRGFRMSELEKAAKQNRKSFQKWFTGWVKEVKERGKELEIHEPFAKGAMAWNALFGVAVCVAGIIICILTQSPVGLPAAITGGLQAILTAGLTRRTPKGERLAEAWRALKTELKKMSTTGTGRPFDHVQWDRFVVAGVALGLNKQLDKLAVGLGDNSHLAWMAGGGYPHAGFGGMSQSLSSSVSTVSGGAAGAGGAGGAGAGASGGGGGGAG